MITDFQPQQRNSDSTSTLVPTLYTSFLQYLTVTIMINHFKSEYYSTMFSVSETHAFPTSVPPWFTSHYNNRAICGWRMDPYWLKLVLFTVTETQYSI